VAIPAAVALGALLLYFLFRGAESRPPQADPRLAPAQAAWDAAHANARTDLLAAHNCNVLSIVRTVSVDFHYKIIPSLNNGKSAVNMVKVFPETSAGDNLLVGRHFDRTLQAVHLSFGSTFYPLVSLVIRISVAVMFYESTGHKRCVSVICRVKQDRSIGNSRLLKSVNKPALRVFCSKKCVHIVEIIVNLVRYPHFFKFVFASHFVLL
jgi:hypothetical protein